MSNEPVIHENKPSLAEWFEGYLPFRLPRIGLPQTAKNFDKAVGQLIAAGGDNGVARIIANTDIVKALGQARTTFIEHGSKQLVSGSTDLDQRAMNYVLENARLEQANREAVLELTANELQRNPPKEDAASDIDVDWLKAFSKFSSEKSSDEVRSLWGRVLAGEIKAPGSTNLRSLAQIATYDRADAEVAHEILNHAINKKFVFVQGHKSQEAMPEDYSYEDTIVDGMDYELALMGSELGILANESGLTLSGKNRNHRFSFHRKELIFTLGSLEKFHMGVWPLTKIGESLLSLSNDFAETDDYILSFAELLKAAGKDVAVKMGDIEHSESGLRSIVNVREL